MYVKLLLFLAIDPLWNFVTYILIGLFLSSLFTYIFNKDDSRSNIYYYLIGIIGAYIGGGVRLTLGFIDETKLDFFNITDWSLSIIISIMLLFLWRSIFSSLFILK